MRAAVLSERFPKVAQLLFDSQDERLHQEVLGLSFANPVGLAAGFDKNGERIRGWRNLGFGFSEIGSVTAQPSAGNPRPRAFRLPDDRALINRMGLNNDGAEAVALRLAEASSLEGFPIGINVAKTHDPQILGAQALQDFEESVRLLAPHAAYLALNVSCPNTAEGKTFEEPAALDGLLQKVMGVMGDVAPEVPVLVKLSPPGVAPGGIIDFGTLSEVVAISLGHGVAGFIATNTASDRVNLATDPSRLTSIGAGGLSGRPLAERAQAMIHELRKLTGGTKPLVAVGGIDSAEEAFARIRAGASLVQLYTGLVYQGPGLVRRINRGLLRLLDQAGIDRLSDAVGSSA